MANFPSVYLKLMSPLLIDSVEFEPLAETERHILLEAVAVAEPNMEDFVAQNGPVYPELQETVR